MNIYKSRAADEDEFWLKIYKTIFDRECPARDPIADSSLRHHHHHFLFMKFVQLTIDGAEVVKFGTEEPPGGIFWH